MPRRYDPQATALGRAEMIRKTYMDYADPESGELADPESFQEKIVQNMYRYGDVDGIKEFTQMQRQNTVGDRWNQQMDLANKREQRSQASGAADFVGQLASSFHSQVEGIKDPKQRQEYVNKYYPPLYDMANKAGYGEFMAPEYDHVQAGLVARAWGRKGKAGTEKTLGPGEKARMELHNREVDAYQKDLDAWLASGKKKARFDYDYPEKAKVLGKGKYSIAGSSTSAAPAAGAKMLDRATVATLLKEAGGDKARARQLAKDRGYKF